MSSQAFSEFEKVKIARKAFPTLFPTGKADFDELRDTKVSLKEWVAHLMRYEDGRFAAHPRFRYWALNTIMREDARNATKWYLTNHPDERAMTVEQICEVLQEGSAEEKARLAE